MRLLIVDFHRTHGYSLEFAVIVTLYWLAAGMSYSICGNTFDIARESVFDLVNPVLDRIISVAKQVIKYPENVDQVGEQFAIMADSPAFSLCVGAIDCCQIHLILDDSGKSQEYINRKLYYSINLQALVDHNGRFIDIFSGFPGSCHDLRVFRHSGLYRQGVYPPRALVPIGRHARRSATGETTHSAAALRQARGYFIIGDGGYTSLRDPVTIMIPYKNVNLTENQKNYNHHLSKARVVVERAFGLLQARWRNLFHRPLEIKFKKAVKAIAACCVLHNICLNEGDVIPHNRVIRRQMAPRPESDGAAYRDIICLAHNLGRHQAALDRQK
ncbi:Protein ALP1-like [Frankliniella fusca]|uniref:Protein ALP1-like n=1 Tax=Frankliniella fusca TaxID=407009 RepID=A0AAE1LB38_9NEOP|nr:Protein ALP1-like [Frankliniella fusca]